MIKINMGNIEDDSKVAYDSETKQLTIPKNDEVEIIDKLHREKLNIGEYVKMQIKIVHKKTISWVADNLIIDDKPMNEKNLAKKLSTNTLKATELIAIARLLPFDLEKMNDEVEL